MKNFILYILMLSTSIAFAQQPKVDRSKAPALGPIAPLQVPPTEQFTLSNGLKVYFVKKDQIPLIQLNLYVNGGSAYEKADEIGLASLTSTMMDEGAGGRNALEIADEIDYLGIQLSPFSDLEAMGVRLFSPISKLDQALELMSDVVLKPTFPQQDLDRIRKQLLISLGQQHDEARIIASRAFYGLLFGDDHPIGRSSTGTEATLKSFTVDKLKQFHQKYFAANNAYIVAVGAISQDDLKSKLEKSLGQMPKGAAEKVSMSIPKQVSKRTIYLIDKPGAAQSEICIGRIGVSRATRDYFNITVMNTVLGGSFTSRLNQNLREEHGYSYGAGSGFPMRSTTGYFIASSAVQTDVTDKALTEFFKELTNIRKISDEELTRARNYVALSYPGDFNSVQSISGNISEKIRYNLPDNYFNTYVQNILAVKKADALKVAKTYIDPKNIVVVVVGDRSKIEAGIKGLKLGEIKYMSIDDVLGPVPAVE